MEFNLMEDWDLQAVVKGCSNTSNFSNSVFDFDDILSFCDDQQNGFYYSDSTTALSPQSNLSVSTCLMSSEDQQEHELQKQRSLSDSSRTSATSKKRKNQQKRVVKHVAEDDILSDKWAWRKYGQKPIKGSPFPRSYYRCSSVKGCMAKKQVERSNEDPSVFIVTYTYEHCHPYPTRKSSLAGTSRIKDPKIAKHSPQPNQTLTTPKFSKMGTIPNPPITPNLEDNLVHHVIGSIKSEQLEDEEIGLPDMIFTEDLFPSLDDCEGLFMDDFGAAVP